MSKRGTGVPEPAARPDTQAAFIAVDARSGKPLWHYPTGTSIWGAAAITFLLDGRQYVLIPSGTTLVAFALPPN